MSAKNLHIKRVQSGFELHLFPVSLEGHSLLARFGRYGYKKADAALIVAHNVLALLGHYPIEEVRDPEFARDLAAWSTDERLMVSDMTKHGGYRIGAGRSGGRDEKPFMERELFERLNSQGANISAEDVVIGDAIDIGRTIKSSANT